VKLGIKRPVEVCPDASETGRSAVMRRHPGDNEKRRQRWSVEKEKR
jgi:hypothetical protein